MAARPFAITNPRGNSDWRPGDDPLIVAENIEISNVELRNFTVPLTQARRVVRDDIQERFLTGTDPDGHEWAEWADSYRERAERENKGKLRKTDDLYDAVSDLDNYEISTRGTFTRETTGWVAIVGSNLPDYWVYHQEGTSKMPARPFLGVSDEAEATIYEIFDLHVDGSLAGMVRKTGQPIIRTPRGPRFATFFGR